MLKIVNLKKKYNEVLALDGINLQVVPGRVTGFVGPNGCGKSTLIKSILGLVIPDEGEILIDGVNIKNNYEYRSRIGYMPQHPALPENLMVKEIFSLLEDLREQDAPLKNELIELFNLDKYLNMYSNQLSGGTKQKVSIVSALMFNPEVVILDEPTVGLDPLQTIHFKKILQKFISQNKIVILVSHVLSEVEQLVNDMVFMLEGRVRLVTDLNALASEVGSENITQKLEEKILHLLGNV